MTDVDGPELSERFSTLDVLPSDQWADERVPARSVVPRWSAAEAPVVEQAKGVLMLRYGVGSFEALAALVRWAQDVDVSIIRVARALTQGVCQGRTPAEDQGRWLVRWLEQRLREPLPDQTEVERWSEDG